ncbi:MAG: phenylalanine--tRNA ligase subunit beta [Gammaproteobacteria bacterium]
MKFSELWLREWVKPRLTREALTDVLTMAGLELEELAPVAGDFKGVVIGQILKIEKHPEADRLNICEVDVGQENPLTIVCGASNVAVDMKVPAALVGAVLPNDLIIKQAKLRGVESHGMLCSASELGLSDEQQGLLALPADAPIGQDIRKYLMLDDYTIDLSITPNRGDCLSVRGVAREVSALTGAKITPPAISPVEPSHQEVLPVELLAADCPHYVGRIIRGVETNIESPIWLKEGLRRSGVRSISPVVDATNYVMLELGQPMHAFDLDKIKDRIVVRHATAGEKITLLDGSEKELEATAVVIADADVPVALAGVMGGEESSVTPTTTNIFLEAAYFTPKMIAGQRKQYQLNSDSAHRFERGIDTASQREAIEHVTQIILDILGGEPGPVIEQTQAGYPPARPVISLPAEKITRLLGIEIAHADIQAIFNALNMEAVWQTNSHTWEVKAPSYRPDITIPEDLIEEIARLYGYDKIPTQHLRAQLQSNAAADETGWQSLRLAFSERGYHEIISYSFVGKEIQAQLDPEHAPKELLNPITSDMTVMRTNLWPGLINTYRYNKSRQQHRIRLFEIGACFITKGDELLQTSRIGGLISGSALPEQWGGVEREVDFYDLKGDLENIIGMFCAENEIEFKIESHAALHPGRAAAIYCQGKRLGLVGAIHPGLMQPLDVSGNIFVFELDLTELHQMNQSKYKEFSKFPEIRRDLAILVNDTIRAKEIQDTIRLTAGDWLQNVFIFDVYQGKGITPGSKSVALRLVVQHPERTLVDSEVAELMERVIASLKEQLGAELRS